MTQEQGSVGSFAQVLRALAPGPRGPQGQMTWYPIGSDDLAPGNFRQKKYNLNTILVFRLTINLILNARGDQEVSGFSPRTPPTVQT